MLPGEGDTDDGDGEEEGKYEVDEGRIEAAADQPDDIAEQGQAAAGAGSGYYFLSEGEQRYACQFKALEAEGKPDDRKTEYDPAEQVA